MPTFQGQISDEQLNALVAYVKSLGPSQSMPTGGKSMAGRAHGNPVAGDEHGNRCC